mgnify:CR=1 FL=1
MKLTQMIEKFAKQGMLNGAAKMELLQAAEEAEQEMAELQEALSGKDGELAENRKTAAVTQRVAAAWHAAPADKRAQILAFVCKPVSSSKRKAEFGL